MGHMKREAMVVHKHYPHPKAVWSEFWGCFVVGCDTCGLVYAFVMPDGETVIYADPRENKCSANASFDRGKMIDCPTCGLVPAVRLDGSPHPCS